MNHPPHAITRGAVWLLELYKRRLSPFLPPSCRFTPTCSEYARLALLRHGLGRGGALTFLRLLRCQSLHPGGVDLPWSKTQTDRDPSREES